MVSENCGGYHDAMPGAKVIIKFPTLKRSDWHLEMQRIIEFKKILIIAEPVAAMAAGSPAAGGSDDGRQIPSNLGTETQRLVTAGASELSESLGCGLRFHSRPI